VAVNWSLLPAAMLVVAPVTVMDVKAGVEFGVELDVEFDAGGGGETAHPQKNSTRMTPNAGTDLYVGRELPWAGLTVLLRQR
jgi:hypothetical protein